VFANADEVLGFPGRAAARCHLQFPAGGLSERALLMIQNVIVLGGGSAGFLAAIALKRKIPALSVRVVRSPDIGIIGVGEGTTRIFPKFLFEQLGLNPTSFYALAQPTWKLGIRFLWGPRPFFDYTFLRQLDWRYDDLPKRNAFYAADGMEYVNLASSLMSHDKVFARKPSNAPAIVKANQVTA
jgi:tryptophan halogenase